ncbi:MAG: efflux RND transporter periplasmic adaptor subunit [Magnetococcales bacterium]|nr:efflux RND transporter periplasmic adaptor subunit [Magnetococcales bacterium]
MFPRPLSLFIAASWGLLLAGCSASDNSGNKTAAAKAAPPPMEVEMVSAVRKTIALQQQIPGRLQAVRTAEIRARVAGIVEQRLFSEGSEVKAGALLYRLDARPLESQLQTAQALLDRSQAERQLAKQTMERMQPLLASHAVSRQEFEQAEAQYKKAVAEAEAAEAGLHRARIDLEYAHIAAPIEGRIGRSLVTEGALVGQKEATHLATIEQLDPIWVNFSQSSPEFFRLRRAMRQGGAQPVQEVDIRLLLEDNIPYPQPGKLQFTDMAVDPLTGSVALRAEFPNPDKILLPGQYVQVQLALATAEGVTVPQRAVQAAPQGQIVLMVNEQQKVTPRPIQTGGFSGQDWIVTEGLKEGEKVILNGVQKARPGSVVTPKDWVAPPPAVGSGSQSAPGSPASASR